MDIETYLQSDEAVRDVADALPEAKGADIDRGVGCMGWDIQRTEKWIRMQCYDVQRMGLPYERIAVYFRAEGSRFVVTDLGEGIRARRLRTGRISMPSDKERDRFGAILNHSGVGFLPYSDTLAWQVKETAAGLPRAIVGVMLAAWRVANLNLSSGA